MTHDSDKKRGQVQMFCMDDLVLQDHLLRAVDGAIDWRFIYDLVEEKYSPEYGSCRTHQDPHHSIPLQHSQHASSDQRDRS